METQKETVRQIIEDEFDETFHEMRVPLFCIEHGDVMPKSLTIEFVINEIPHADSFKSSKTMDGGNDSKDRKFKPLRLTLPSLSPEDRYGSIGIGEYNSSISPKNGEFLFYPRPEHVNIKYNHPYYVYLSLKVKDNNLTFAATEKNNYKSDLKTKSQKLHEPHPFSEIKLDYIRKDEGPDGKEVRRYKAIINEIFKRFSNLDDKNKKEHIQEILKKASKDIDKYHSALTYWYFTHNGVRNVEWYNPIEHGVYDCGAPSISIIDIMSSLTHELSRALDMELLEDDINPLQMYKSQQNTRISDPPTDSDHPFFKQKKTNTFNFTSNIINNQSGQKYKKAKIKFDKYQYHVFGPWEFNDYESEFFSINDHGMYVHNKERLKFFNVHINSLTFKFKNNSHKYLCFNIQNGKGGYDFDSKNSLKHNSSKVVQQDIFWQEYFLIDKQRYMRWFVFPYTKRISSFTSYNDLKINDRRKDIYSTDLQKFTLLYKSNSTQLNSMPKEIKKIIFQLYMILRMNPTKLELSVLNQQSRTLSKNNIPKSLSDRHQQNGILSIDKGF